ncbi:SOS response-associated peptidase [Pendulispora rubella]|uniref:Abasic site processing protein n=1 Tax=Pendulispora rubella TaxID=2741070 RepID=A0ABZ2KTQ9_9BACT
MCGRGNVDYSTEKIRETFAHLDDLAIGYDLSAPRLNLAPTDSVPVVRRQDQRLRLDGMRWGRDKGAGRGPVIWVRSETAARGALASRQRGLIVFGACYEWKGPKGTKRTAYALRARQGELFALAALCDRAVTSDGGVVESCTMLTQPALGAFAPIHDRMPILVGAAHFGVWVDGNARTADLLEVLRREQQGMAEALEARIEDPVEYARDHGMSRTTTPARKRASKADDSGQGSLF